MTSRERLRVQGEHVYPVPVLERAEARRLFVTRARAVAAGLRAGRALGRSMRAPRRPAARARARSGPYLAALDGAAPRAARRTGSTSCEAAAMRRCGSRRFARRSSGRTSCSSLRSGGCSRRSRSSRAAGRSRRPSRSAMPTSSCTQSLVDKSLVPPLGSGPLRDARDDPRVRGRAALAPGARRADGAAAGVPARTVRGRQPHPACRGERSRMDLAQAERPNVDAGLLWATGSDPLAGCTFSSGWRCTGSRTTRFGPASTWT